MFWVYGIIGRFILLKIKWQSWANGSNCGQLNINFWGLRFIRLMNHFLQYLLLWKILISLIYFECKLTIINCFEKKLLKFLHLKSRSSRKMNWSQNTSNFSFNWNLMPRVKILNCFSKNGGISPLQNENKS